MWNTKKEVPIPITYPETAVYIITFTFTLLFKFMISRYP